ncbi:hypothetical protein R1sor_010766 [Riccia sorocarpa]|uniref:Uncharacterized protein n=1 Tax=Riccia sorocarpa TaxID=122646 RepID=A0ABD3HYZ1_9MARC
MSVLVTEDGETITSDQGIATEVHSYFKAIYQQPAITEEERQERSTVLSMIDCRVTEEENREIAAQPSMGELTDTIESMAKEKAPGEDGTHWSKVILLCHVVRMIPTYQMMGFSLQKEGYARTVREDLQDFFVGVKPGWKSKNISNRIGRDNKTVPGRQTSTATVSGNIGSTENAIYGQVVGGGLHRLGSNDEVLHPLGAAAEHQKKGMPVVERGREPVATTLHPNA